MFITNKKKEFISTVLNKLGINSLESVSCTYSQSGLGAAKQFTRTANNKILPSPIPPI